MSFSNNNLVSALFLITFLFAASYPLAHGQTDNVLGLSVSGRLCCTPTGNCPGQAVDGVPVRLTCNTNDMSDSIAVEEYIDEGYFSFNVYGLNMIIYDPIPRAIIPCVVNVPLPLNATVCPELSYADGNLVSAVQITASVTNTTIGLVQNANITGFVRMAA